MKNNLARNTSHTMNAEPKKKINVVQCPACQTKFAVDQSVLSSVEIPRFHCSRCDNVFTVDRSALGLSRTPQPVERSAIPEPTPIPEPRSFEAPKTREVKSIAPASPATHDEYQFTIDFPPATDNIQDTITKSFDFGGAEFLEKDDSLSVSGEDFGVSVMKDPFDLSPVSDKELESRLFAGIPKEEHHAPLSSPFLQAPSEPTPIGDEPMGYAPLNRSATRNLSSDWSESLLADDLNAAPYNETKLKIKSQLFASMNPRWRGCATMCAPIVGFLLVLGIFTAFCVSNPQGANALAQSLLAGSDMPAPADLYITDSKIKRINLESGEMVSVISGTIVNKSEDSFNEVMIEGLLFDRSGNIIARKKINAASSLGRSRIQSLSPEMIEDLQNAKPAKRFELKEGQIYEFTMAIPEEVTTSANSPSSFSARIYSVRAKG